MSELREALAEISAIRGQVARVTQFRGYGPASIAASGVLGLGVAAAQARYLPASLHDVARFLAVWIATAAVSVSLTMLETIGRARRVHSGLAREMIQSALEQFLPALIVGSLLTAVLVRVAPQECWMLPGLWALVFSLGVFASCRFLPRPMFAVGVWYLVAGLACLAVGSERRMLSAWAMGLSFGLGQLQVAAVLRFCSKDSVEEG